MPKTRGTGLLMAWTDVDPGHEDEFNRWAFMTPNKLAGY